MHRRKYGKPYKIYLCTDIFCPLGFLLLFCLREYVLVPKLLTYEEIFEWQRDNEYIRTGYRPEKSDYKDIFLSLMFLHNETCIIYSHLIGVILVLPVAYIYMRILPEAQYPDVLAADYIMLIVFFFSCEFCLLSSAMYYLMQPHSHKVEQFWHRMDLLGAVVIIGGTFIAAIYYFFICKPAFQTLHWVLVSRRERSVPRYARPACSQKVGTKKEISLRTTESGIVLLIFGF
jgi:amino acid transporter